MSFLYTSASGRQVQHGSHSALSAFRFCRRKFKLNRIDGWRQKGKKASLEFGKCIEEAIAFYHANGLKPDDCAQEFKRLWLKWSEQELIYTDQEESWANLYVVGSEMTKLYEVRLPNLPIRNPKFQLQYQKNLWPGTELADLSFMGYVDMLSTLEDGRRLVIDIKTAKSGLDLTPGMVAMDPQLREYAWLSGIQDVAFLWFVKCAPGSFKHGDEISLFENSGKWKAGDKAVVVKYVAPKTETAPEPETEEAPKKTTKEVNPALIGAQYGVEPRLLIGSFEDVEKYDTDVEKIAGKGSGAAKEALLLDLIAEGKFRWVARHAVTKTKLQWVQGTIPVSVLPEVGQRIGHDMLQIKQATETSTWPQDGGVRFPNQVCTWCDQRGHCLGDRRLVEEMLVQIKTQDEPDWLSELEEEAA